MKNFYLYLQSISKICSHFIRKNIFLVLMWLFCLFLMFFISCSNAQADNILFSKESIQYHTDAKLKSLIDKTFDILKVEEGYSAKLYKDAKGYSICYGLFDADNKLNNVQAEISQEFCKIASKQHLLNDYDNLKKNLVALIANSKEETLLCMAKKIQKSLKDKNPCDEVNPEKLYNECLYRKVSIFDITSQEYQVALMSYVYQYGLTFFYENDKKRWIDLALCLKADKNIVNTMHCKEVHKNFKSVHLTRNKGLQSVSKRRQREMTLMFRQ